jgi:HSP20 family protein
MAKKSVAKPGKAGAKAQVPVATGGDWFDTSFMDLRRQIDRLFDSFAGGFHLPSLGAPFGAPALRGGAVAVRFDVSESDDAIEVSAELPGLEEKDVEVVLEGGVLTVKGEKKAESEKTEKDFYVAERSYGAFRRSFRLPDTVDENKIQAAFDKGVLKLVLPKLAAAKRKVKKIPIS